eukprot:1194397-Prorocentrum_minimum.AAC.4
MRRGWGLRARRSGISGGRQASARTTSPPIRIKRTATRAGCRWQTGWATARRIQCKGFEQMSSSNIVSNPAAYYAGATLEYYRIIVTSSRVTLDA